MEKRLSIHIVLLVIVVAFIACYAWGVVRTGDERADETLIYFKDAEVGDWVYHQWKGELCEFQLWD